METLERIPFETQKQIFKRLEDIVDVRCLKSEDMEKYEESQRMVDNYNLGMYSAWLKGTKEGRLEGRAEGMQQGKLEGKLEIVRNLLLTGMSLDQITQVSGLTLEQLNQLKN